MNTRKLIPVGFLTLLTLTTLTISGPTRSLFPFDNGLTDIKSVEQQAVLLKELGYAGICTRPKNATAELYAAMDNHGLKICASYVVLPAGKGGNISQSVIQHMNCLKGRNTVIWLGLTGKALSDEPAVAAIRKIGDLAQSNGLTVALYPHTGFYAGTVKTCLRLIKKANHPNVGVSFCLCHFLKQNDHTKLEATIQSAAPHLRLVQINGAELKESGAKEWSDLIKPLGTGNFDMNRLLRALDKADYNGPFNLQCYKIAQPARKHLGASMNAWKQYHKK